jgi:hypothetical protein
VWFWLICIFPSFFSPTLNVAKQQNRLWFNSLLKISINCPWLYYIQFSFWQYYLSSIFILTSYLFYAFKTLIAHNILKKLSLNFQFYKQNGWSAANIWKKWSVWFAETKNVIIQRCHTSGNFVLNIIRKKYKMVLFMICKFNMI